MDTYDLLFIFVLLLVNVMITEIEKKHADYLHLCHLKA